MNGIKVTKCDTRHRQNLRSFGIVLEKKQTRQVNPGRQAQKKNNNTKLF